MSTDRRRAAARRRAWGRGPVILRFEALEGRQLLSTVTTIALPDLVPVAFAADPNPSWGGSFHVQGTVANQGPATVNSAFLVNIYASPTSAMGPGSVLLGQATVPAGLLGGGQASYDQVVNLPTQPISGVSATGTVYIQTLINPDNAVTESDTLNDSNVSQGVGLAVVAVAPATPAVLTGAGLSISPTVLNWGQTLQVSTKIYNNSTGNAPGTRARVVLTPTSAAPGGASDFTIGNIDVPAIAAGQSATLTQNIVLPGYPPLASINSTGFTLSVVPDADFKTNPVAPRVAVNGNGYDMVALAINAPTTTLNVSRPNLNVTSALAPSAPIELGQTFEVVATLQNTGNLDAGPFRVRYVLVGSDSTTTSGIFLADATVSGLAVGATQTLTQNLQLPYNLTSYLSTANATTQARIAVVIDPEHAVDLAGPGKTPKVSGLLNLKLIAADGTATVIPATATATTTTTTTKVTAKQAAATKAAAALAARKASITTTTKKKFGPTKPVHTFSHNLKVFPSRVTGYVKDLIKKI
jgi:CARDB